MKRSTPSPSYPFLATIYKIWIMRHVDVPEGIASALIADMRRANGTAASKKKTTTAPPKHIPVIATVNHFSVQTTLVPAGDGRFRMSLSTPLRKAGGADAGEVIGVTLRYDTDSRDVEMPIGYVEALTRNTLARKEFDRLPPGHRRQLVAFYLKAKSDGARGRAMEKTIAHLRERALLRPEPRKPVKKAKRGATKR